MTTASYGELVESTLEVLQLHPVSISKAGKIIRSDIECEDHMAIRLDINEAIVSASPENITPQIKELNMEDIRELELMHTLGSEVAGLSFQVVEVELDERDVYIAHFKNYLDPLVN